MRNADLLMQYDASSSLGSPPQGEAAAAYSSGKRRALSPDGGASKRLKPDEPDPAADARAALAGDPAARLRCGFVFCDPAYYTAGYRTTVLRPAP